MQTPSRLALTSVLGMAFAMPADAGEFLSPALAMERLADTVTGNGRTVSIIFNSDGSGMFQGPITMGIDWTLEGENVCIDLGMAGTKCVCFKNVGGRYEGYRDGALDLTLFRPG